MSELIRKKITVIGNSVALRIRPPVTTNNASGKVYSCLLERDLNRLYQNNSIWEVNNLGLSRLIIKEIYDNPDHYIRTFPDIYILNMGCVEAPNREIPLWFSNIVFKRSFLSLHGAVIKIYESIIKRYLRRPLLLLRRKKSWISLEKFEFYFKEVLNLLQKETQARIIVIGINQGNERIEKNLPGTLIKYKAYTESLKQICDQRKVDYVDVSDLDSATFFPDGVHYNEKGHCEVNARLLDVIRRWNEPK